MDTHHTVINAGIGGNNTRQLLDRIDTDVLAHKPSLVCLLAGANDLLNSNNSVPFGEYQQNIRSLAGKIREGGSKLLLLTILPCYTPYLITRHPAEFFSERSPNKRITEANTFIRKFCTSENIPFADTNMHFNGMGLIGEEPLSLIRNAENSDAEDGVHPTADGYRMIASTVYCAIRFHKLPTEKTVCFGDSITYGVCMEGEGTTNGHTYPAFLQSTLRQN